MSYTLTEADKKALYDAIDENHYIPKPENGVYIIEMYADYRDSNEGLLETAYDAIDEARQMKESEYSPVLDAVRETIEDWFSNEIYDEKFKALETVLDAILSGDNAPENDPEEIRDALRDYLDEHFCFEPPYEHFLNQPIKVNILLDTPEEANQDHALIHYQRLAMVEPDGLTDSSPENIQKLLHTPSGLTRLVESQGYQMEDLARVYQAFQEFFYSESISSEQRQTMEVENPEKSYSQNYNDFAAKHGAFLSSVCEDLDNHSYSMGCITVLACLNMNELAEMLKPGSEIRIPQNATLGIFNPWNGSGGTMGIALEKPLSLTDIADNNCEIQIEGVKSNMGYTVNDGFGLVGSCWKGTSYVGPKQPERKPSLDDLLKSASSRQAEDKSGEREAKEPEGR